MNSSSENLKIKIIGVGEEGENILKRFAKEDMSEIELIAVDVDGSALNKLSKTGAIRTVLIGKNIAMGLEGATLGERAAEESAEDIKKAVDNAKAVVMVATLGGKAASGATPFQSWRLCQCRFCSKVHGVTDWHSARSIN